MWQKPNAEGIIQFLGNNFFFISIFYYYFFFWGGDGLVKEKGFELERVKSGLKRLEKTSSKEKTYGILLILPFICFYIIFLIFVELSDQKRLESFFAIKIPAQPAKVAQPQITKPKVTTMFLPP